MEKTESDNIKEIFACEYRKNTKWRVKKKHIMLLKDAQRGQNNMKRHVKFLTEVVNWYIKCFAYMQNIWSSPNDLKSRCWFLKIGSVMKLRYCKVSHHWISEWVPCPAQLRKIIAVSAAIARNQRPVKRSICKVVSKRPAWMCKDDCYSVTLDVSGRNGQYLVFILLGRIANQGLGVIIVRTGQCQFSPPNARTIQIFSTGRDHFLTCFRQIQFTWPRCSRWTYLILR